MPSVSVVVPVYNSAGYLRQCLEHLYSSTIRDFECIVVDDGSTDDSAAVAREFGARVIHTEGRRGPAHARNLGAAEARADILYFIDSDVLVYPGTLGRIIAAFQRDRELDALIGSYDDSPGCGDFLSQYRNLMHCYVHQTGRKQAVTFWSGCGAIRRWVFLEHGGFDDSYGRPAIEDIELGYRLAKAGKKLALDRHLLVKHLKKWSLWNVLKTDVRDRGIPWTELILRDQNLPNDLNVQTTQRLSVAVVFLLIGIAALTAIRWGGYFLAPLFALLFFLLARYWVDATAGKDSRKGLIGLTATIGGIVVMEWMSGMPELILPVALGYLLLVLRHRYAYATYTRRRLSGVLLGLYLALAMVFVIRYLPDSYLVFGFFLALGVLVALNCRFYVFLAAKRGRLFAVSAIPFHLLYHFYCGISFGVGLLRHLLRAGGAGKAPAQARAGGGSSR